MRGWPNHRLSLLARSCEWERTTSTAVRVSWRFRDKPRSTRLTKTACLSDSRKGDATQSPFWQLGHAGGVESANGRFRKPILKSSVEAPNNIHKIPDCLVVAQVNLES